MIKVNLFLFCQVSNFVEAVILSQLYYRSCIVTVTLSQLYNVVKMTIKQEENRITDINSEKKH